jgi:hypothetical protein
MLEILSINKLALACAAAELQLMGCLGALVS